MEENKFAWYLLYPTLSSVDPRMDPFIDFTPDSTVADVLFHIWATTNKQSKPKGLFVVSLERGRCCPMIMHSHELDLPLSFFKWSVDTKLVFSIRAIRPSNLNRHSTFRWNRRCLTSRFRVRILRTIVVAGLMEEQKESPWQLLFPEVKRKKKKQEGKRDVWRDFLNEGVYDPRLLLIIGHFAFDPISNKRKA